MKYLRILAPVALAAALVVVPMTANASSGGALRLTFDGTTVGANTYKFSNSGSAEGGLSAKLVTNGAAGAEAIGAAGRAGDGKAIRLPAYSSAQSSSSSPFAAIRVLNTTSTDLLDPGTADFSFGADFALNSGETGPTTGANDNGNNLIQRGLTPLPGSTSTTQYKIQVDHRVPTCRLVGVSSGAQRVVFLNMASNHSFAGTVGTDWYRAICTRTSATSVTFSLTSYTSSGSLGTVYRVSTTIPSGFSLSMSSHAIPLSVGGKLGNTGAPASGSRDQFNGLVDNAFLDIS